jgi:hypothetical protein
LKFAVGAAAIFKHYKSADRAANMKPGRTFLGIGLGKMCHGKFTMPCTSVGGNVTEAAVQIPILFSTKCSVSNSL